MGAYLDVPVLCRSGIPWVLEECVDAGEAVFAWSGSGGGGGWMDAWERECRAIEMC
jgi:hypothetical protein